MRARIVTLEYWPWSCVTLYAKQIVASKCLTKEQHSGHFQALCRFFTKIVPQSPFGGKHLLHLSRGLFHFCRADVSNYLRKHASKQAHVLVVQTGSYIWGTLTNYSAYCMTPFDILPCFMLFFAPKDVSISHALDREIWNGLWRMAGK